MWVLLPPFPPWDSQQYYLSPVGWQLHVTESKEVTAISIIQGGGLQCGMVKLLRVISSLWPGFSGVVATCGRVLWS